MQGQPSSPRSQWLLVRQVERLKEIDSENSGRLHASPCVPSMKPKPSSKVWALTGAGRHHPTFHLETLGVVEQIRHVISWKFFLTPQACITSCTNLEALKLRAAAPSQTVPSWDPRANGGIAAPRLDRYAAGGQLELLENIDWVPHPM